MSGVVVVGIVAGVAALVVAAVCTVIVWLDKRDARELPPVNVDADEELEHLARRERLHVVPVEHVEVDPPPAGPYDWFREEDWR